MTERPPHHSYSQPRDPSNKRFRTQYDHDVSSLRQQLIDLDGDGVPDVAVPAASPPPSNAMRGFK